MVLYPQWVLDLTQFLPSQPPFNDAKAHIFCSQYADIREEILIDSSLVFSKKTILNTTSDSAAENTGARQITNVTKK